MPAHQGCQTALILTHLSSSIQGRTHQPENTFAQNVNSHNHKHHSEIILWPSYPTIWSASFKDKAGSFISWSQCQTKMDIPESLAE